MALQESARIDATTTVFPVNSDGDPTGPAFPITSHQSLRGRFAGLYLQDEWTITSSLTLNFGARFDSFDSPFDNEAQLSPRLNLIGKLSGTTTLHAGYARYFTPPPVEDVPASAVAEFAGTSNAPALGRDDPVKTERADYFDAGLNHSFAFGLQVGLDAYYKRARQQLDDGLFGQTLILSAFNYGRGEIYGLEFSTAYNRGGFSTYANVAHSVARGRDWVSSQFLFDPADLAYVHDHWIALDHDQTLTGSFGASYHWKRSRGDTQVFIDALYGSGLRTDATTADGSTIPNGGTVPSSFTINTGIERTLKLSRSRHWKIRLDVVNGADKSYALRDGSGVGVNAAQYGMRRGCFGTVGYVF